MCVADFLDSYQNLTFKAMSWMHWTTQNCHGVRWIVKTDDDILVNPWQLQGYLATAPVDPPAFHCLFWHHMRVVRDPSNKWYDCESDCNNKTYRHPIWGSNPGPLD